MSDHTAEPWVVSPVPNDWLIRSADQHLSIAEVFPDSDGAEIAEWRANARRIVACVNACAGISNELLEQHPAAITEVYAQSLIETKAELTALRQQVADLRAALEFAKDHIDELREAWQRGVIRESDGLDGTRSNRNVDVQMALRRALAATQPQEVQP